MQFLQIINALSVRALTAFVWLSRAATESSDWFTYIDWWHRFQQAPSHRQVQSSQRSLSRGGPNLLHRSSCWDKVRIIATLRTQCSYSYACGHNVMQNWAEPWYQGTLFYCAARAALRATWKNIGKKRNKRKMQKCLWDTATHITPLAAFSQL